MLYDYCKNVGDGEDSSVVAENVKLILAEELGMEQVKLRSELTDGKYLMTRLPYSVSLIVTLDDRPFVNMFLGKILRSEDVRKRVFGTIHIGTMQVRKAARIPGAKERRERLTFGDKVWRENKAKHGIEVSFETKPSEQVLALLKGVGFRYGKSGIWWAKDTPEIRKAVMDMGLTERPAA